MAEPASHATLDYSVTDRVAYATLRRPESQNAFTEQTLDELNDVVARVQHDTSVRALVLSGQGEVFSTGMDSDVLATLYSDIEFYEHILTRVAALGLSLEALDVPVIAAVNGTALEVGFDLALACDLIVIADEAMIGDGRSNHGRVPGGGATVRLPRAVGVMHARGARRRRRAADRHADRQVAARARDAEAPDQRQPRPRHAQRNRARAQRDHQARQRPPLRRARGNGRAAGGSPALLGLRPRTPARA
jgi:enoyl-CoA hydratase/carnithine racemase